MSRYLTEPEAWQEIARRIAEGEWVGCGLCAEIEVLHDQRRISLYMVLDMEERVESHLYFKLWAYEQMYAYEPGEEEEARILAALWLALEAEEDGLPWFVR